MIDHLNAVKAVLSPLRPCFVTAVPQGTSLSYPYFLVWPSNGSPGPDGALDRNADLSFLVSVTSVGVTADSAGILARSGRSLLGPDRPVRLPLAGRLAWVSWSGFATAGPDEQVTLPASNSHPVIEVHQYRVESTPA